LYKIAPANARLNDDNTFVDDMVQVRNQNEYPVVPVKEIDYMDVAPQQLVSVATAIIPFLENDDANRALMGANMQRQAVPTVRPHAPIVKTGMEKRAARDSGTVILAERAGTVVRVTCDEIVLLTDADEADKYKLMNMVRSNQGTCITQRPVVNLGQRIKRGDVLADGPCTDGGELALGQNILVAFVPWYGYNFEDAILLSQRLIKDDVYTSIHIEKYEVQARDTKLGPEEITRDIPNVGEDALKDLDENGIIRIGAEVRPDDILVGRVAPKGQSELTAEERLIIAIFGKKAEETRDVSLRVPHGEKGKIVDVKIFSRYKYKDETGRVYNFSKRPDSLTSDDWEGELERLPADELAAGENMLVRVYIAQKRKVMEGDKMAGRHGNKGVVSRILPEEDMPFLPDGTPVDIVLNPLGVPSRMNIGQVMETHLGLVGKALNCAFVNPIFEGSTESEIIGEVKRYAEVVRKGLLAKYASEELGIELEPKRKDTLDALYERLGAAIAELEPLKREELARQVAAPPAIELPEDGSLPEMPEANEDDDEDAELVMPDVKAIEGYDISTMVDNIKRNVVIRGGVNEKTGKFRLRDGLTGEYFQQDVTVGQIYMLKLHHLVDDKIHARSTGPYSLVTQQPLGGKAQFGGQRFGEMEVWALEAYGAAYTLQEILTIKSDDVLGRVKTYEAIVKGDAMLEPGVPESFKILVNELQSLGLKVTVEDEDEKEIDLKDREDDFDDSRGGMRFAGAFGPRPGAPAGNGAPPAPNSGAGLLAKRGFVPSMPH
jgi:DNA-directed RNA polymerase subunit beta